MPTRHTAGPRHIRLGHIINALFTLQSAAAAVARGAFCDTSPNAALGPNGPEGMPAGQARALPVVEVNGFEPMTSCLQSRRTPS
jgi:hypothetical protein